MGKALTVSALLSLRSNKPVQLKLCIDYKDEPMNTCVLHRLKRRLASVIFRVMKVEKQ